MCQRKGPPHAAVAPLPDPRSAFSLFFPPRLAFGSSAGNNSSPPWPRPRARAGDGRGALLSCGASPRCALPSSLRWHHRRLRRQRGWGWIVKGNEEKKKMDACHRWSGEAAKMPAGSVGPKPAGGERRVCSPSSRGTWRTGGVVECRLSGAGRMVDDGAGEEEGMTCLRLHACWVRAGGLGARGLAALLVPPRPRRLWRKVWGCGCRPVCRRGCAFTVPCGTGGCPGPGLGFVWPGFVCCDGWRRQGWGMRGRPGAGHGGRLCLGRGSDGTAQ